jgi:hypothetical protein
MKYILFFIIICVALFFIFRFLRKYKVPKLNSLVMVTGGVKCGKSTLSVHMAISTWKRNVRATKFGNFFRRLFKKVEKEIPLLYSNVPLKIDYVPVTRGLLLRKERFVYGSVVYLQEASLVADSQLIKNKEVNNELLLFFKLFGHESKGGTCILDTQCIGDVHYSIKRSLSEYYYVHHLTKWIPFILIAHVVEDRYSDDGTIIKTSQDDTEFTLRKVIFWKKTWKYFDCYTYSCLTDDLPVVEQTKDGKKLKDLKSRKIFSFREEFNKVGDEDSEKENFA